MYRIAAFLALITWLAAATASADQRAAAGKLLVATDEVQGEIFARTLILLLHYDEAGAMGLVVNRPTDVTPEEVLDDPEVMSGYRGTLFWGGPVEMAGLRALLRSDSPPEGATMIIDGVYLAPFDDTVDGTSADATTLRIYIGYAGWAAGQLDYELAGGSWDVRAATAELVFDDDPGSTWQRLRPVREYQAAVRHAE